jgi:uncharacterized protein (DUF2062 family)
MLLQQIKVRGKLSGPGKLSGSVDSLRQTAALWLQQGLTPRRLALTLALGFAIGCIPVVGIPTLVCAVVAMLLGLNQPAIQAANYAVMPLQLLLMVPLVKLGGRLVASTHGRPFGPSLQANMLLHTAPIDLITRFGWLAGQALLAWVVLAVPTVLLLTFTFTLLLRRIPALAAAEAAD